MASRFVLGDYLHGALLGLPVRASRYPSGYLFGLLSGSCGFFWGIGWGWVGEAFGGVRLSYGAEIGGSLVFDFRGKESRFIS